MTEPKPILAVPARLALKILHEDDVARVHAAALELLGAEGVAADAAARKAPDTVVLGGRAAGHHVLLGAGQIWLGTGGPAARVRPRDGGDPLLALVLRPALPVIDVAHAETSPSLPSRSAPLPPGVEDNRSTELSGRYRRV